MVAKPHRATSGAAFFEEQIGHQRKRTPSTEITQPFFQRIAEPFGEGLIGQAIGVGSDEP